MARGHYHHDEDDMAHGKDAHDKLARWEATKLGAAIAIFLLASISAVWLALSPAPYALSTSQASSSSGSSSSNSTAIEGLAGSVRSYELNITRQVHAPDGVDKRMILVNGQSPGPLIEANTGETIRVVVHNRMDNESTTIHWHGIDQRDSNWMDGVLGVTQCAIRPGHSFTYEFGTSDQRGTFWYHAHVGVQYTDGLYGPLIIHDLDELVPATDREATIFVGDHYHEEAAALLGQYLGSSPSWSPGMAGMEPPPDNIVINGQNGYGCQEETVGECDQGSLYQTATRSGESMRLRLISHSTNTPIIFTIDDHVLRIVEVDGVEVEPVDSTRVYLNPGQRYSVVVEADAATPGNYYMRAVAARSCFHLSHSSGSGLDQVESQAKAILAYEDAAADDAAVRGTPWALDAMATEGGVESEPWTARCADMPFDLLQPRRKIPAYNTTREGNRHSLTYKMASSGETWRTYINETLYVPSDDDPVLWQVLRQQDGDLTSLSEEPHLLVSGDWGAATQVVINSQHMMNHPWHLHGQNFQIVGWGYGPFSSDDDEDGSTTWNLDNPMRRDTVTVPGNSHVVLRFAATNPGVWALHCHILWHAEGGMIVSIAQGLEQLQGLVDGMQPDARESVDQLCSVA